MPHENLFLELRSEDPERRRQALHALEDCEHVLSKQERKILNEHRENYRELLDLPR